MKESGVKGGGGGADSAPPAWASSWNPGIDRINKNPWSFYFDPLVFQFYNLYKRPDQCNTICTNMYQNLNL